MENIKYILLNVNIKMLCILDIEELLGKPVQTELSSETGLNDALNTLVDLLNGKKNIKPFIIYFKH